MTQSIHYKNHQTRQGRHGTTVCRLLHLAYRSSAPLVFSDGLLQSDRPDFSKGWALESNRRLSSSA
jgi:hypothetical protein